MKKNFFFLKNLKKNLIIFSLKKYLNNYFFLFILKFKKKKNIFINFVNFNIKLFPF
jgi:hypothetical protein